MNFILILFSAYLLSTYLTDHSLSGPVVFGHPTLGLIRKGFAKVGLEEVTTCPLCASIWMSGVAVLISYISSIALMVLAVAGALCLIAYIKTHINNLLADINFYMFVPEEDEE